MTDSSGILNDREAVMASLAVLVERALAASGEETLRISQADYDNIAYKQLLEGFDHETGEMLLKIDHTRRELS